ncbi:unnamed protein product [Rotaria magnacalcarata]|uniref:Uncharacterized protein n=3 Tax=Rotaria magnacalcarata TaxID=392030 RepID=A0A816RFC4_9BILA|nr:unnamed protein product [Rotaria magnacalcarata]
MTKLQFFKKKKVEENSRKARHRSDRHVNNREIKAVVGKELATRKWKDINVGDIVRLTNNDFLTVYIVLISTSELNGLCFIETAEFDGETNLKVRQALEETCEIGEDIDKLSSFDAQFEHEAPNNNLGLFDRNLIWNNKTSPLKNDNLLLHDMRLRNTRWEFGIVCYAGSGTKLMKNTAIMCTIMTICCDFWESSFGFDFRIYLPWEACVSTDQIIDSLQNSLLVFISYIIIFNTVVPISLSVSIEFIRLLQSQWIDWNIKMYHEPNNVPAQARTISLNEELGQVGHIFSDKTGILTQNIITFNKCSLRRKLYGYVTDQAGNEIQYPEKIPPTDYESAQTVNSKDDYLSKDEPDFRQTSMNVAQATDPLLLSLNNES